MEITKKLYCNSLGCKMAYAAKAIMKVLLGRFEQEGLRLTLEQYFILNILDNEEGLILQDLANIVEKDKSAVARHIDGLEDNNFVVRTTDPDDHRRKILIVTKPGIKALEKGRKLESAVNDELVKDIDKSLINQFGDIFAKIYKRALQYNG